MSEDNTRISNHNCRIGKSYDQMKLRHYVLVIVCILCILGLVMGPEILSDFYTSRLPSHYAPVTSIKKTGNGYQFTYDYQGKTHTAEVYQNYPVLSSQVKTLSVEFKDFGNGQNGGYVILSPN